MFTNVVGRAALMLWTNGEMNQCNCFGWVEDVTKVWLPSPYLH